MWNRREGGLDVVDVFLHLLPLPRTKKRDQYGERERETLLPTPP
jgi:hypothetical protein